MHRATGSLLVLAFLLMPLGIAQAHEGLQRSVPAKGAVLTAAPASLRLTFTSAPNLRVTRLQLLDAATAVVELGALRIDSVRTVVADIRGALRPGAYTVTWQVVGADGHPVRGQFSFTIAPGATGLDAHSGGRTGGEAAADVPAPGATMPPEAHHDMGAMGTAGFDAESPAYVVVRWIGFMALLAVIGAVVFQLVVLPLYTRHADAATLEEFSAGARGRSASLGTTAAAILVVAAVVRLYAQSYAMHGAAESTNPSLVGALLFQTVWGWGWLVQVVGAVAAFVAFRSLRRGRGWGTGLVLVAALALAATPALSGHAVSVSRLRPLAITADTLHVVGAAGWLGSLLFLLMAGIPAAFALGEGRRGRAVADLVNAFSPTALIFAGLASVTGLFSAWLHLESFPNVWGSAYGRVLLLKLAILSIVAATGGYNWLRVRPALGGDDGAARIRRSSTIEVGVAIAVLLVTAILVATPTPMDMSTGQ